VLARVVGVFVFFIWEVLTSCLVVSGMGRLILGKTSTTREREGEGGGELGQVVLC
jgi:hypothetical protein